MSLLWSVHFKAGASHLVCQAGALVCLPQLARWFWNEEGCIPMKGNPEQLLAHCPALPLSPLLFFLYVEHHCCSFPVTATHCRPCMFSSRDDGSSCSEFIFFTCPLPIQDPHSEFVICNLHDLLSVSHLVRLLYRN